MEAGRPMFTIDLLMTNAAKEHGVITCMAAANNIIVLGTSTGWIVRHDLNFQHVSNIDLSKGVGRLGEKSIHRVFLDPEGCLCIATVVGSGDSQTFYMHTKWTGPQILNRMNGLFVNAVAWNRQTTDASIFSASTREVILGTSCGQLHLYVVYMKEKKHKYMALRSILQLPDPLKALQMETVSTINGTSYYVMALTPTRLHSITGIGSLYNVFRSYESRVPLVKVLEDVPNSALHFFTSENLKKCFAWLSGRGIYHGVLDFGEGSSSRGGDNDFLLEYSKLIEGAGAARPSSLAVSKYHFMVLIGNKIKVVNIMSEQVVEELHIDETSGVAPPGVLLGLCSDASSVVFYTYDQNSIFKVSVNDEGRDMWRVYLDMKLYSVALANCHDQPQKDQVFLEQAEDAFSAKNFAEAVSLYARISCISFEEISLKFISVGEQDSLRSFLLGKLDELHPDDQVQTTMILEWIARLFLNKIENLVLSSPEYQSIVTEFNDFLTNYKDALDEATTMELLGSYGRVDELVCFAYLKEQYETVIHYYIQQREAKKALEVLQKAVDPVALQYKFASELIMLDAYETVESWMITENLNPRKLIPAMMKYSKKRREESQTHEVIKYLEDCVHRLQNEDPVVHNLLIYLYVEQEDESSLLQFLGCKFGRGRPASPDFFYKPEHALRICHRRGRKRACVQILSRMSMHKAASSFAFEIDLELAMDEANKVEDNDERKKLWILIWDHFFKEIKGSESEKAKAFLKKAEGVLRIDDILPFLSDLTLIDDFKEEICSSFEDYRRQIKKLDVETKDAYKTVDMIKEDIRAVASYSIINGDKECGVCRKKILTASGPMTPFYVFPCGHLFHAQCLITHVTVRKDRTQAEYIHHLQSQLALSGNESVTNVVDETPWDRGHSVFSKVLIRSQLDDAIASECPFCSDLMIQDISMPFILPEEDSEVASFKI